MTAITVVLCILAFTVLAEGSSESEDSDAMLIPFILLGVVQIGLGLFFGSKARQGEPTTVLSAACFQVCTLLAFLYVSFLNTTSPAWILIVVGSFSALLIWIASPNKPMIVKNTELQKK